MKVLITGGCGFIGSNLAQKLSKENVEIVLLDNLSRSDQSNLAPDLAESLIIADVCDKAQLKNHFNGIDVVIHLAAQGSVVESVVSPEDNYDVNATGTFNVLKVSKDAGIKNFIFASTGGALVGDASPPVNESSTPRPISPYGASKLAGEGYCCAFANAYDMNICALRFANITGPLSFHKKGAVTKFFKSLSLGKNLCLYGDGTSTRDYLDVRDLCEGIIMTMNSNLKGFNVFHLASGIETSIHELANLCIDISGVNESNIIFESKRAGEVERNFADTSLIKETLGWEPKISLDQSLRDTWQWMQPRLRDM